MIEIYPLNKNKIIIETDDPSVKCLLEYKRTINSYNPFIKIWENKVVIDKIYENTRSYYKKKENKYYFILGQGWIPLILTLFKNYISQDNYNLLMSLIYSFNPRTIEFPGLRDYQNEDILFMLKYRRGLLQVSTGYGKTQCIATLMNYFHNELGKNVLVVTPGSKPRDEIIKRYKSLFGEDVPRGIESSMSCVITSGFMNRKCMRDKESRKLEAEKISKYEVVLADELEYTCGNDAGNWIYDNLINAELIYGFSGTASKKDAKMLTFASGITDTVMDSKEIISTFGCALVFRLPTNIEVDNITIYSRALDNISFTQEEFTQDSNIYLTTLTKIWTDPDVCKLIVKIIKKFPRIFIGINELNNVIFEWINNYFIPERLRVLLICSDGYIHYDENGNSNNVTLEEAADLVNNGHIDVIPSTASGFRGIDFNKLENVLLVVGNIASQVCQIAGRAARGSHMNILTIENKSNKLIPCYSKGLGKRRELIQFYYKYCNITDIYINEDNL